MRHEANTLLDLKKEIETFIKGDLQSVELDDFFEMLIDYKLANDDEAEYIDSDSDYGKQVNCGVEEENEIILSHQAQALLNLVNKIKEDAKSLTDENIGEILKLCNEILEFTSHKSLKGNAIDYVESLKGKILLYTEKQIINLEKNTFYHLAQTESKENVDELAEYVNKDISSIHLEARTQFKNKIDAFKTKFESAKIERINTIASKQVGPDYVFLKWVTTVISRCLSKALNYISNRSSKRNEPAVVGQNRANSRLIFMPSPQNEGGTKRNESSVTNSCQPSNRAQASS